MIVKYKVQKDILKFLNQENTKNTLYEFYESIDNYWEIKDFYLKITNEIIKLCQHTDKAKKLKLYKIKDMIKCLDREKNTINKYNNFNQYANDVSVVAKVVNGILNSETLDLAEMNDLIAAMDYKMANMTCGYFKKILILEDNFLK